VGKRPGSRIILIGFSTTGKSRVGQEVAQCLGWRQVDTDDEIVKLAGKSIGEIFAQEGEAHFRQMERRMLLKACRKERVVISAGGGAILDPRNRDLMKESGFTVCLEAAPQTIYQRLLEDAKGSGPLRPLLAVPEPLHRIHELKDFRQPYYAIADWTVHTDNLTVEEVGQEVVRGWYYWKRSHPGDDALRQKGVVSCEVVTAVEHYPVLVGWGLLGKLGKAMQQAGLSGNAYLISDETVFSLYGMKVARSLQKAGLEVESFAVPPGEATKTIETAITLYDWLTDHRAERGDTIVALGGGMIGDLAGFVAATFLRGLPLVQVPTSLVAMVDASVGGKTAVNHPQAKNMVGVFHQPRLVVADVQTLNTLPRREMVSGWAEVIKHGLILDADLCAFLEANADKLMALEPELTVKAIGRSAAIKAMIVSQDEKERGRRTLLNYGHTIGHGLEAATNYQRFLHGEAVAVGMAGAALIAHRIGLLPREAVERQRLLLERFGLPTQCSGVELDGVVKAMDLDKKVRNKAIRWVLLADIGKAVIRNDVSPDQASKALEYVLASS